MQIFVKIIHFPAKMAVFMHYFCSQASQIGY